MAKFSGAFYKFKGSIGNITFRRVNGTTVVSEKVEPKATPSRSYAQMRRRMQWANIVNLWGCFEGNLHPSFEGRKASVSDFNEFVSANLGIVPVYLTKGEASADGSVAAGYQVTRGSLPEIAHSTGVGDVPVTDIALGGLAIGPSTTLKQFSDAVCQNNSNYQNGDQISCFHCTQTANAASGVPYVRIIAEEVTLDRSDNETLLYDVCSALCFSSAGGVLGAQSPVPGAICWIHSRKTASGTKVSTQRLQATNPLLPRYQSAAQLEAAIESYGGTTRPDFLTPNASDVVEPE